MKNSIFLILIVSTYATGSTSASLTLISTRFAMKYAYPVRLIISTGGGPWSPEVTPVSRFCHIVLENEVRLEIAIRDLLRRSMGLSEMKCSMFQETAHRVVVNTLLYCLLRAAYISLKVSRVEIPSWSTRFWISGGCPVDFIPSRDTKAEYWNRKETSNQCGALLGEEEGLFTAMDPAEWNQFLDTRSPVLASLVPWMSHLADHARLSNRGFYVFEALESLDDKMAGTVWDVYGARGDL